jgi:hypothetical protein
MRIEVGQWSTGDAVEVCLSKGNDGVIYASISNPAHYEKVQATLTTASSSSRVACDNVRIVQMYDGGGSIDTSDGLTMNVSTAGVMRIEAGQWSTGDAVQVCKSTLADGSIAASIQNSSHYEKIQATVVGQSHAVAVQCRSASISSVGDGGASVTSSDGRSYTVSTAGVMRIESQQWTSGEQVQICEAKAPDGTIAASIENPAHYEKVQAFRS